MLFSMIVINRYLVLLALFLILAIGQSIKSTVAVVTLIAPRHDNERTWILPSQLQKRSNTEGKKRKRTSLKGIEGMTPSLNHNSILKISRGGDSSADEDERRSTFSCAKVEKGSLGENHESSYDDIVSCKSAIVAIGAIDLSETGSSSPDIRTSIVLVVDGDTRSDGIVVDEILLQRILLPQLEEGKPGRSIQTCAKEMKEDVNAILESLALLCDVLVVRMGKAETLAPESVSYVMLGSRQRQSAGMAGGKHWQYSMEGTKEELRRLVYDRADNEEDDNHCHSSTTTWSTLFPSSKVGNRNEDKEKGILLSSLKELFTSLSQQVIRSKHSTSEPEDASTKKLSSEHAFVGSFPPVTVLHVNKESGDKISKDSEINESSFSTKSENTKVKRTIQTPHHFDKDPIESKTGRTGPQLNYDGIVRDAIGMAYRRLEDLEEKMQELVLDQSSNPMPLLEFGDLVQDIFLTTEIQLKGERGMHDSFRRGLMKGIVVEVQRLYKDQLQALRNYYGQRYESILDEEFEDGIHNDENIERKWATGAEHMTQAFLAAARNAIPAIYRADLEESKDGIKTRSEALFDHVDALQGLIQDMMESTERRKDEQDVATMILANEEEGQTEDVAPAFARAFRLPKLPKWLERLAARALVFGVNYVQGWLAWQGIKRAALERDRNQPKFPLF